MLTCLSLGQKYLPSWPTEWAWSGAGMIIGYHCISMSEVAAPPIFHDNFLCWDSEAQNPDIHFSSVS